MVILISIMSGVIDSQNRIHNMKYIQIDDDTYIETDGKTASVLSISSIQKEIEIASEQIAKLSSSLSDEELLRWARANYTDQEQRNREVLQSVIDENTSKLDNIVSTSVDTSKLFMSIQ